MTSNILKSIKELLIFYVKTHYENYLKEHNLTIIIEEKIHSVIKQIYTENNWLKNKNIIKMVKYINVNN